MPDSRRQMPVKYHPLTSGTWHLESSSLLRCRFRRVEALDHFLGEIETRVGPDDARVAAAENHLQATLLANRLDDRHQLLAELLLEFLRQILDFGLCVLLRELDFTLHAVDVFLERGAG